MMRILILGDVNSAHIQKWGLALAAHDIAVGIYSMGAPNSEWYLRKGIQLLSSTENDEKKNSVLAKLSYYKHRKLVKNAIKNFQPQLVHAHYASSYGMLARHSGFTPYIVSVWGSDVFEFPKKNFLTSTILRKNLYSAAVVLATSVTLQKETQKHTHKEIKVIPFGIDTELFKPLPKRDTTDLITIGIVKAMEDIYGIDILIDAFSQLYADNKKLRLKIVGDGTKLSSYKLRIESMGLSDVVRFTGRRSIPELTPSFANMDICVFPSRMESFGVAQLEAAACGKPVIATRVGGVPEVVINEKTGILIDHPSVIQLCKALERLIGDPALREKMGMEGRRFVEENYNLKDNVDNMIAVYQQVLDK